MCFSLLDFECLEGLEGEISTLISSGLKNRFLWISLALVGSLGFGILALFDLLELEIPEELFFWEEYLDEF